MRRLRYLVLVLALLPAWSYALIPLGFGLALLTGISESSLILPLTAASAIVGVALTWVTLGGSPGSSASSAPVMVQIEPTAPVATPPGWTAPAAGQVQPTPPSTASTQTCFSGVSSASSVACDANASPSAQAAGDIAGAQQGYHRGDGPPATETGGTQNGGQWFGCDISINDCWATNNGKRIVNLWKSNNCPIGYTSNGSGGCNLSNASVVKKPTDGRCYIVRSGNSYGADPNDPDCLAGLPAEWTAGPNFVSWAGKGNGDGGGAVTIDAGTSRVTVINNKQNSDGTTTTTTVEVGAPDAGAPVGQGTKVIGVKEETRQGQGTQVGGTTSAPPLQLPTDYNREATQQQIRDDIRSMQSGDGIDTTL